MSVEEEVTFSDEEISGKSVVELEAELNIDMSAMTNAISAGAAAITSFGHGAGVAMKGGLDAVSGFASKVKAGTDIEMGASIQGGFDASANVGTGFADSVEGVVEIGKGSLTEISETIKSNLNKVVYRTKGGSAKLEIDIDASGGFSFEGDSEIKDIVTMKAEDLDDVDDDDIDEDGNVVVGIGADGVTMILEVEEVVTSGPIEEEGSIGSAIGGGLSFESKGQAGVESSGIGSEWSGGMTGGYGQDVEVEVQTVEMEGEIVTEVVTWTIEVDTEEDDDEDDDEEDEVGAQLTTTACPCDPDSPTTSSSWFG